MKPAVCSVCGEPALPHQRNVDGSYTHDNCAATLAVWPPPKKETTDGNAR